MKKNIPLLQHKGIRSNYSSVSKHQDTGDISHPLVKKISSSAISPREKEELTELVRSLGRQPAPEDDEVFVRYIEYLIRLKEARSTE